jgi:hypothetical protein
MSELTAPPNAGDMENVRNPKAAHKVAGAAAPGAGVVVPSGRVAAIVRRNWKHYCGSIAVDSDDTKASGGSNTVASVLVSI